MILDEGPQVPAAGRSEADANESKQAAPRPREARQSRMAHSFSQVVAVLMRDPNFRNLRLADLEWLVLPPVMSGQFRLAQAPAPQARTKGQDGGMLIPVAVALWARVSDAVDRALAQNLDKQMRLRPGDWVSGDNLWLMVVGGDERAVPTFLKQLGEKEFAGKQVKLRTRGPDGTVVVKTLGEYKP